METRAHYYPSPGAVILDLVNPDVNLYPLIQESYSGTAQRLWRVPSVAVISTVVIGV